MRAAVLTCLLALALAASHRGSMQNLNAVPKWAPTWNMQQSTIVMPCNFSGLLDPVFFSQFGLVDIDWCVYLVNVNRGTCMW